MQTDEGTSAPVLFWLSAPTVTDAQLNTADKKKFMTDAQVQEFDALFSSSDLSFGRGRADKSRAIRINLRELTAGQETADGVHFGLQVYDAVEQCILNALQYLCRTGGQGKEQSEFCSRATTRIDGKTQETQERTIKKKKENRAPGNVDLGAMALVVLAMMLGTFDMFSGLLPLTLLTTGRVISWSDAYGDLNAKIEKTSG